MNVGTQPGTMTSEEKLAWLHQMEIFKSVPEHDLERLAEFPSRVYPAGARILSMGQVIDELLVALTGEVRLYRSRGEQSELTYFRSSTPGMIGDNGLLSGVPIPIHIEAMREVNAIVVDRESFWRILADSPALRAVVLLSSNASAIARDGINLRAEKLASLGTLTAGLMHELNNPGAAAGRAAAQLRENLNRMHAIAREFSEEDHTPQQMRCIWEMQEMALSKKRVTVLNSLDQSDAEEELLGWMDSHHITDGWRLAPTFAASGVTEHDLDCLEAEFNNASLSEPLAWMEAMVSSMQMVDTIEESINRVSALVGAVKIYTHEGQGAAEVVDINRSVFSTVVILTHKMRERNIELRKDFGEGIPGVPSTGSSLNQVWTNLIDNAIDAAGEHGTVQIRTWHEDGEIFVSIADDGDGIPIEEQARIFDPFFTTKPSGVGTGLGLGIAYQIVSEYSGEIHFISGPEGTEFVVHLPVSRK